MLSEQRTALEPIQTDRYRTKLDAYRIKAFQLVELLIVERLKGENFGWPIILFLFLWISKG